MTLILSNTFVDNSLKCFNKYETTILKQDTTLINLEHLRLNQSILYFVSKLNNSLHKSPKSLLIKNINDTLIYRSLWQKLVNKYWQETIFISKSNILSEHYTDRLQKNGLSVYNNNDYKNFLLEFSRALLNSQIEVSINSKEVHMPLMIYKNNIYLKYIWRKSLNAKLNFLFKKSAILSNLSTVKIDQIKKKSLPIFAITNTYNQLIMAESPEQILLQKNYLHSLYKLFTQFIFKNQDLKTIYTGLIFIHPEDALEYKEYIISKYNNSSYKGNMKTFTGQLNLYYKLLFSSNRNTQFKLIPDLREVSLLVHKYQYLNNLSFNDNQQYGKDYFQGQPIYSIQSILAINKITKEKKIIDYSYSANKSNNSQKYTAIFLNYKTALLAWDQFRAQNSSYNLPSRPLLSVYNLEAFLKNNKENDTNIIFVPSSQIYQFIKEHLQLKQKNNFTKVLIRKTLFIKSFFTRAVWSLTSRQPTNW